ncbi:hypothetical protein O8C79_06480 [Aliarcobacter butzleri]|uniref:hypothetical protein n=1 Tax=Aliarcobacter butzleri TaxID=28197 RepID=UPI00263DD2C7|nr:hypothetical protein [Aliarcobacter butzleri]MDN5104938.1 hypothetical protein [Aliarcobacter butzleri]
MSKKFNEYFIKEDDINPIIESFILEEDIVGIAEFTRIFNCAISFREAKAPVLKLMRYGAGTKPHSIMFDKTLKNDTSSKEYEFLKEIGLESIFEKLEGYVTYYREFNEKKIFGIYLTKEGKEAYLKKSEELTNGRNILLVDKDFKEEFLNNPSYFITGDYDTHDIVSFTTQAHTIPSELDFEEILNPLNYVLASNVEIEKHTQGRADSTINAIAEFKEKEPSLKSAINAIKEKRKSVEYYPIQHGAQVNYLAHVRDKEKEASIIKNVANMSDSVAICSKGKWLYLKDKTAIKKWYEENSVRMKQTWTSQQEMEDFLKRVISHDVKVETINKNTTMFILAQTYDPYQQQ